MAAKKKVSKKMPMKMTERMDDAMDMKMKIKDGSKKDIALDKKRGLPVDVSTKKSIKKVAKKK